MGGWVNPRWLQDVELCTSPVHGSVSSCRLLRPVRPRAKTEMHAASGRGAALRASSPRPAPLGDRRRVGRAAHLDTDAIFTEECVWAVAVPAGKVKMTETYDSDI